MAIKKMAHRKKPCTIREAVAEMSIAGEPQKVATAAEAMTAVMNAIIDTNNLPSVDNMILAMDVMTWELKDWRRTLYSRQHPKTKR